jgi:small conductance mechanosensitive channel
MDLEKAWQLIVSKLTAWLREFVRLLPNIALAALILVIGFFVAKFLKRLSIRIISRITHHDAVHNLLSSFIHILTIAISFFIALSVLQLDKAVTSILAGAGIVGLALAFAFQDIAANFMAGIFLAIRHPLRPGDLVRTNDFMGKVQSINLRDTVIRTFQGQVVIIPNKEIFQKPIENFTRSGRRRLDLSIGVSYGDDLDKVKEVTLEAVKQVSVRLEDEPLRLFFEEFAESSVNLIVQIWVNSPEEMIFLQGKSEAIQFIKKAYDQNNITIPFPIRTLDFGMKGGERLSEMKLNINGNNR